MSPNTFIGTFIIPVTVSVKPWALTESKTAEILLELDTSKEMGMRVILDAGRSRSSKVPLPTT